MDNVMSRENTFSYKYSAKENEEIQNENEQYQSTDDLGNANSIMDDQRKKTSMEMQMISLNNLHYLIDQIQMIFHIIPSF